MGIFDGLKNWLVEQDAVALDRRFYEEGKSPEKRYQPSHPDPSPHNE
jgi:hypothetical protein